MKERLACPRCHRCDLFHVSSDGSAECSDCRSTLILSEADDAL